MLPALCTTAAAAAALEGGTEVPGVGPSILRSHAEVLQLVTILCECRRWREDDVRISPLEVFDSVFLRAQAASTEGTGTLLI